MTRHIIFGRLGTRELYNYHASDDESLTILDLVAHDLVLDHGVSRALNDLMSIGISPTDVGLDLLIIAAHVQAADTRISRKSESQDTWTREIKIVAPVSDPERWTKAIPILIRMLNFLTGDIWLFEFRPRPLGYSTLIPKKLLIPNSFKSLSLFSGGLDSLIGAIDFLEKGDIPLFISHAGDSTTSYSQEKCFDELKEFYQNIPFNRLRLWMNFDNSLVNGVAPERTSRGRSFLFFSIGVFAGSGFENGFKLYAPENGLIALNVPLDPLRLGALSTRTMHPFYLSRWNELLRLMGISGQIENPYWRKTKGEMVEDCANQELLKKIVPLTLSCSAPSKGRWQSHGIEHCGYCLPCIIRRAALLKVYGLDSDPTSYTLADLESHALNTRRAQGKQFRSIQFALERLRSNPEIADLLIHKPGPLNDLTYDEITALSNVYKRGMNEVAYLIQNTQTVPF